MAPLGKRSRGIKQPTAFNPDSSAAADAPQAKKSKKEGGEAQGEEEEEEADSPEEVWEDAKDLWERAMEAAGESDPSPAIPLLRGIVHEFDRILRNSTSEQPLDVQPSSSTDSTSSTGIAYSKEAFYFIYATSLSTLGLLLSQLPQLAHPSEPSPLDFQIAASGFFTQHAPSSPSSSWSTWKHPLAHGRTLVLSASEKLDEDPTDEGAEDHITTPTEYLKDAIKSFELALTNLPSSPSFSTSPAAPTANRDPITTFLHSTLPLQLRLRTLLSIATSIGVLVERIDEPTDRLAFATWADDLLARVGTEALEGKAEGGSEWEYEVAVGRGAVWLGVGGREAEIVEEDVDGDASKEDLALYLEKSLKFLSRARELKPLVKKAGEEEVEDELSPMLVEVALTFGLVLDGDEEEVVKRREELEELARREGWNGEDEEEEEEE
ncbi:hypothetical protein BDY24DRAFT_369135 [Mrakia frigida]|uniref:uncharacterized protein n=1 Tax=Mrakia frigida TaxID=29902 RepID=UPI003FCC07A9